MPTINLADWRPDVAIVNSPHVGDLINVLPADGGYIPMPQLTAYSSALAATPISAYSVVDTTGTLHVFAGTATKLYKISSTSWTDVSKAATTYAATADTPWRFARFGDYVIAVNPNDNVQVYHLGVSTTFDNLAGSPPASAEVKVWGDYLVLIQATSDATSLSWCDTNDITNWSTGVSGSQVFPDGGKLMSATEATNPIIFLENAIYAGTFVPGSTVTFTFQKIHDKRGAISIKGVASRGEYSFFADKGGFFQIAGGQITPIGFEKVDRTIFQTLSYTDAQNIDCTIDPFYSRVYWSMDLSGSGTYDTILVYDWNLQRWTKISQVHILVFPAATPGYTLDGLDALGYTLDTLPYSLDSKVWQAGAPLLAAFDSADMLSFFSGQPLEATITTQEAGDVTGNMTCIRSIYPVVERTKRSDAVTYSQEYSPNSVTGRVDGLFASRFHRVKIRIPASTDWTEIQAVDADVIPAGKR